MILGAELCSSRIFVGGLFWFGGWVDVFADCGLSLLSVVRSGYRWLICTFPSGLYGVVAVVVASYKTARSA